MENKIANILAAIVITILIGVVLDIKAPHSLIVYFLIYISLQIDDVYKILVENKKEDK